MAGRNTKFCRFTWISEDDGRKLRALAAEMYAALWNARSVLGSDLGEQVGRITGADTMHDLRDAFLQLADATIHVADGRLGKAKITAGEEARRRSERKYVVGAQEARGA